MTGNVYNANVPNVELNSNESDDENNTDGNDDILDNTVDIIYQCILFILNILFTRISIRNTSSKIQSFRSFLS